MSINDSLSLEYAGETYALVDPVNGDVTDYRHPQNPHHKQHYHARYTQPTQNQDVVFGVAFDEYGIKPTTDQETEQQ